MPRPRPLHLLAVTALALAALAVRVVWIPVGRHVFDGHEADYLSAFLGASWTGSTRLYPLLAGLYALLGRAWAEPWLLLGVNVVAGVATVLLVGRWIGRRYGRREGWLAAALLAASPVHAFWSTSAYNVAIPHVLLAAGLALGGWRGAGAYALACTTRIELALLAPAIALLGERKVAVGAVGAAVAWPLLEHTATFHPPSLVWSGNAWRTAYAGPLGEPLGLVLVALAITRRSWPLALAALWTHLTAAAFDDYGYRHALFAGTCLAALVATGEGRHTQPATPALALLALGTSRVARDYYLPMEDFTASLPELGEPPACTEILDDPLHADSHWAHRLSPPAGRICWGEERIHRAWTSRGLQDRALRMHTLYDLEPIGVLQLPGGPRLVYEVRW